jgi:hypothetical protein
MTTEAAVRNPEGGDPSKSQSITPSHRIRPMSEHDQSKKFADKSAASANDVLQKGKTAVERSAQALNKAIRQRSRKCEITI